MLGTNMRSPEKTPRIKEKIYDEKTAEEDTS
jgi:hypothetical protein